MSQISLLTLPWTPARGVSEICVQEPKPEPDFVQVTSFFGNFGLDLSTPKSYNRNR